MLKVYLDWNVISHLKDKKNRELREAILRYSKSFIFPYSEAHLHDLRRGDESHPGYQIDQDVLNEICGTHLLEYDGKINSAYPYKCDTKEYNIRKNALLSFFHSGFSEESFSQLIASSGVDYTALMNLLSMIPIPPINILNMSAGNLNDLAHVIFELGGRYAKDKNLSTLIRKYIEENTTESERNRIKYAKVETVFQELDSITIPQIGKSFLKIISDNLPDKRDDSLFVAIYLALDAVGFRTDKKRTLINKYSDAQHAYYASKCDVLVTNDRKLKEKAQAIYNKFGIKTLIMSGSDLIDYMEDIANKEYDLLYFLNHIAPKYAKPSREEGDLLYYKQIPYPVLGLFNFCSEVELPNISEKPIVLRLFLPQNGFVYFTELDRFFNLIEMQLDEEEKEVFRKDYRDVFMSRNRERILKARYSLDFGSFYMHLMADPDSPVPLPMMAIAVGAFYTHEGKEIMNQTHRSDPVIA